MEIQLIEVKRVLSNNEKINTSSEPEALDINLIQSFRAWHKGSKDNLIEGEMTLVVLKSDKKNEDGTKKTQTMLIEESYKDFLDRMSSRVIIKRLID
jgi:hypothetical protein